MGIKMKIIKAPYINQGDKFPTGCESVSAVMLLQYLGYSISDEGYGSAGDSASGNTGLPSGMQYLGGCGEVPGTGDFTG